MEKGEKSTPLGLHPILMRSVQTTAAVASNSTGRPLQSAPALVNVSKATSTLSSSSQFGLPLYHQKGNMQQMEQPRKLPETTEASIPSATKLASCRSKLTPMQEIEGKTINLNKKEKTDNSKDNAILRSGKWTVEEEIYASILIQLFEEGRVDEFEQGVDGNKNYNNNEQEEHLSKFKITNGMTLRAYLSRKLFCSPMRISKKFAGKGIGKLIYMSQSSSAYQQHWQRLSSSSISNLIHTNGTPLRSANRFDELNRLKQAESNFLRIAFPSNHPMNVYNKKKTSSKYTERKAPFAATASPSKQSASVPVIGMPLTKKASADIENQAESARIGPLHIRPSLTAMKVYTGDSIPALTTPRLVQFPCRSLVKDVGNTVNSPSVPIPNQSEQLQHDQSCRINIPLVKPQRQPSVTSPTTPMNVHGSVKNLQKLPSPLMAAPKLLSPTQNEIQQKKVVQTSWVSNDLCRVAPRASAQLQKLECGQKRQTIKKQTTSRIETLREAYLTSVSPSKQSVVTNGKSNNCMAASSLKAPPIAVQNNSASYASGMHENVTNLIQEPQIKQSVAKTENKRIKTIERCNDNEKLSMEAQCKSLEINSYSTHPSNKLESAATFDWNQMIESPSKQGIDLPNFLLGFDKVSKDTLHSSSDQSSEKDAECDLQQCAEFSPAYHTSKSFDDFHRYLGKGLSPTISPPPKFPNLRNKNIGPAIPSIESNDKTLISNLQMRPRNQQNMIPTLMNSELSNSKTPLSISERSDVLNEADAEAIISSYHQQTPQTQHARGKIDSSGSNQYNNFEEKLVTTLDQQSTNNLHKIVPNPNQNQIRKEDSVSDFPIEGMTFEDFETLASYPDTLIKPYSTLSDKCATVGNQSDGSDDSISRGKVRLLSENSDGMHIDESFQGKKRKLRPPLV